jgi:4-hydroxy-tetrahydrodipicolinate synthase
MHFKGTGVALVTPFLEDGSVDYHGLQRLVRSQIEGGTDFLVVQGTTAETATLTSSEKEAILSAIIKENNGQLPIVLGIGGNNTAAVAEEIRSFNTTGIDGFLSVSPYYNKPSQEGIFQHFKALSEVSKLPIIAYNVPGRTGSNMTAQTTLRIAELEHIVAIKEASGNMEQVMEIIQHAPSDFAILSGDDALTLSIMACGGHGVISVVANAFPVHFSKMVKAASEGDFVSARKLHYSLLTITHQFFAEGNPSGVKVALKERGICGDTLRLPLTNVSEGLANCIVKETQKLV